MIQSDLPPVNGSVSIELEVSEVIYRALQLDLKKYPGRDFNDHLAAIVRGYLLEGNRPNG